MEKLGPAFLPMISDTFVPAPGNYISRIQFSMTGLAVIAIGLAPYYSPKQPDECISRNLLLGISTVCGLLVSVIGAVCEDGADVKSCMGDSQIHDISATTLFLSYDVYMVVQSMRHAKLATPWRRRMMLLSLLIHLICHVRFLPTSWLAALVAPATSADAPAWAAGAASLGLESGPWLAVVEYLDTAVLFTWIATHTKTIGEGFRLGYVRTPTPPGTMDKGAAMEAEAKGEPTTCRVLVGVSVKSMADASTALAVATLAICYVVGVHNGTIHPETQWPMISDMFVSIPGDMISRFGVCMGAVWVGMTQVGHWVVVAPHRTKPNLAIAAHACSLLGVMGLMGVGAINEDENITYHYISAITFFGGFMIYMVLDLIGSAHHWRGAGRAGAVVSAALFVGCKLTPLLLRARGGASAGSFVATLESPVWLAYVEWAGFAALLAYLLLSNNSLPTCATVKFAFFSTEPAGQEGELRAVRLGEDAYVRM